MASPRSPGLRLGYRRNIRGAGSWVLAAADGREWTARVGTADDYENADNEHALTFHQAAERGRQMTRGQSGDTGKPATVTSALDTYEADLRARDGDGANASRARHHLTPALLAKPLALLTTAEPRRWRDDLVDSGSAQPEKHTREPPVAALMM
jgi:hypothetical protein